MKFNFETAIARLLNNSHLSKRELWEKLGITRQGFEHKMKHSTWSVNDLASIAEFFELEEGEFLAIASGKNTIPIVKEKQERQMALTFGQDVEKKILAELEALREQLVAKDNQLVAKDNQLSIKDRQLEAADRRMEGLQRTIDTFCGPILNAFRPSVAV